MLTQGFYQVVRGGDPAKELGNIPDGRFLEIIRSSLTTAITYQDGKVIVEKGVPEC